MTSKSVSGPVVLVGTFGPTRRGVGQRAGFAVAEHEWLADRLAVLDRRWLVNHVLSVTSPNSSAARSDRARAVIGDACVEITVHDDAWLDVAAALEAERTGPVIGRIECGGFAPAPPDATPDFVDEDARGWTRLAAPHLVMGAAHVRLGAGTVAEHAAEQGHGPRPSTGRCR